MKFNYINKDLIIDIVEEGIPFILCAGIALGSSIGIYTYNKKEQEIETPYKISDTIKDASGNTCKLFDIGEHKIIVSRNDIKFESEQMDGYMIESVKKDNIIVKENIKITYVNVEPVLVKATKIKGEEVYFNEFGTPQKQITKTR